MVDRRSIRWLIAFAFVVAAVAPVVAQAAKTGDLRFVNASCVDAYTEIARVWELDLNFDRRFKNDRISLEMEDVTALEALETLAEIAGHFIVVQDDGGLTVINETPQNRRKYGSLVMATLTPGYIPAEDLANLLRSLIEARRIAVNEQLQTVTMRDTASKICVATRLLEIFDQPPSEIELEVQLIQLEGGSAGNIGHRVEADALRALRSGPGATRIASFGLSAVGSTDARLGISAPSGLPGTMSLRAWAGNPHGTRDVTLRVQFDWTRQFVLGEQLKTERFHNIDETVSLTEGEAIVVPVKIESPEKTLVLTVEPRIVRASVLDPAAMESFEVGTETDVSCPGHTSLADALTGVEIVHEPEPVVRKINPGPPPGD